MANSLFDNVYLGSFGSRNSTFGMSALKSRSTESFYIICQDEPDGRKRIYTNVTQKELQTILKHIPDVELNAEFNLKKWLHPDMDLNDPANLPYIFPDYDKSRWEYDILYDTKYHDKMITVLSLWLSLKHRGYNMVRFLDTPDFWTSNLCQEILLPDKIT